MRMDILKGGLLSLIAAGLASCGGEAGQPLSATSAATVLGQLNTVLGQLPRSNTAPTLPGNGGLTTAATKPGLSTLAASDCETVSPTTPVDADNDSIAATKTGTFNCTDQAGAGNTYTRKGSYTVKDSDETVAGIIGGMTAEFNLTAFDYTTTGGDVSKGSHIGNWSYKGDSSGGLTSTAEYNGLYYFKSTAYEFATDYNYGYTWTWSMKPDNSGTPWTTGSQTFRGDFTLSGQFAHEGDNNQKIKQNGTFKMSYYSKDIKYDSTCTKWYRSGSIFMDDTNGNIYEIRYSCATAELYVNGVASDWWDP